MTPPRYAASPLGGLWAALQLLTRLPLPAGLAGPERLGAGIAWFPWVGLLLGSLLVLADALLRLAGFAPLAASGVVVALLLALTGALHADGVVDTADAALGHATPERRLEIMRDPRAGSFGVAALATVLLLKVVAVDALPPPARSAALLLAPVLGRWAIVLVAVAFPAGRAAGLGAPLKSAATPRALALASPLPLALCAWLGPPGLWLGVLAGGAALGLGRWLAGLLPGLTGDCYGAVCESVETLVLLAAGPLLVG